MKHKKILLGTLAVGITTLVPIATIISCGKNEITTKKVAKPQEAGGSMKKGGISGEGVFIPPTLNGTTVTSTPISPAIKDKYKNADKINVTYTLKSGYVWSDGTSKAVTWKFTVKDLDTTVVKPGATTTAGEVVGINNYGKFTATPLTGTTITSAPIAPATKDEYKTGDKITVTYKLNKDYTWADASTDVVNSVYTVGTLQNGVKIPTKESVPLTFTGTQGKGTFKMPTAPTNTKVTITAGGSEQTPSITLSNNDTVTLSFTPTGTNVWTDNTKTAKTVDYTVADLPTGVVKPGATTTAGEVVGINNYGKFTATPLTGTTITSAPIAPATKDEYKTGDKITVTYTLNSGYAWAGGTAGVATSVYTVSGLVDGVTIPDATSVPLTFTGTQGKGTFKMPTAPTNTKVTITAGGSEQTPSITLSNTDTVTLSFTPTGTNVWTDNTKTAKTVDYTVADLPTGVAKPGATTTAGEVVGINNYGKFTATPLTGTTITSAPIAPATKDKYKTGDKITVTYTLNTGYAWADASTDVVNSVYTVGTLQNGVKIPTKESVPLTFTGTQGKGTFKMPTAPTNTKVTITAGGSEQTPSITLSNTDTVTLSFTPTGTNVWTDNTKTAKTVDYTVAGLPTGVTKPGATTTAGKVDGINNYGKFTATPLTGTTIESTAKTGIINKYKNNDTINVTYTLKTGYTWSDGSSDTVTSIYTVKNLVDGLTVPTQTTAPITFKGSQGSGTFTMPTYTNTTFTPPATIPTNLKNGDKFTLKVKPSGNYKWADNTTTERSVEYTVSGLTDTKVTKPTLATIAKATGKAGKASYTIKQFTGMTGTIKSGDKTTNLSNGSQITMTYKLKEGYTWQDGSKTDVTLTYNVAGLTKAIINVTNITADIRKISRTTGAKYTGAKVYTLVRQKIATALGGIYTVDQIKASKTIGISIYLAHGAPAPDSSAIIATNFFAIHVSVNSSDKNVTQFYTSVENIHNGA